MSIFFKSRNELRAFASKNGKKVDRGSMGAAGKRWAFEIKRGV